MMVIEDYQSRVNKLNQNSITQKVRPTKGVHFDDSAFKQSSFYTNSV